MISANESKKFLHWRKENTSRRALIIETLSELELLVVATACHPVARKRQERARQKCLEALAVDLCAEGVTEMVIESREATQNKRDLSTLAAARRSGLAPDLVYRHAKKRSDPLLWVADVIAGIVGLHVTGIDPSYLAALNTSTLRLNPIRL